MGTIKSITISGGGVHIEYAQLHEEVDPEVSALAEILQELLHGKYDADKQDFLLSMTVKDFCTFCAHTAQTMQEEEEEDAPVAGQMINKMFFIRNPKSVECPVCGNKTLRIQDGHICCTTCLHDYGDIDDHGDVITLQV